MGLQGRRAARGGPWHRCAPIGGGQGAREGRGEESRVPRGTPVHRHSPPTGAHLGQRRCQLAGSRHLRGLGAAGRAGARRLGTFDSTHGSGPPKRRAHELPALPPPLPGPSPWPATPAPCVDRSRALGREREAGAHTPTQRVDLLRRARGAAGGPGRGLSECRGAGEGAERVQSRRWTTHMEVFSRSARCGNTRAPPETPWPRSPAHPAAGVHSTPGVGWGFLGGEGGDGGAPIGQTAGPRISRTFLPAAYRHLARIHARFAGLHACAAAKGPCPAGLCTRSRGMPGRGGHARIAGCGALPAACSQRWRR